MSGKQTPSSMPPLTPSQIFAATAWHRPTPAPGPPPGSRTDAVAVEEIRRSGRANKGHHTKNQDALDEPVPAAPQQPKAQSKSSKKGQGPAKGQAARAQSAQSADQEDEEEDAIIRCVCGDQRDIRGRQMICCDTCLAWQHNKCLSLPEGDYWEGKDYYCERCKPEDHQELLAAMARGEKPWARKKGSKPKPRPSDVKPDAEQEKASTPPPPQTTSATSQAPADEHTSPLAQAQDESNGHADAKVFHLNE